MLPRSICAHEGALTWRPSKIEKWRAKFGNPPATTTCREVAQRIWRLVLDSYCSLIHLTRTKCGRFCIRLLSQISRTAHSKDYDVELNLSRQNLQANCAMPPRCAQANRSWKGMDRWHLQALSLPLLALWCQAFRHSGRGGGA